MVLELEEYICRRVKAMWRKKALWVVRNGEIRVVKDFLPYSSLEYVYFPK